MSTTTHIHDEVCSICLESFESLFTTASCQQCKKHFHLDCHISYFCHRNSFNELPCPNCRGTLKYKDDCIYTKESIIETVNKDKEKDIIKNII